MGRFAWVFYFAINIMAFYSIFHWLEKKHKGLKITGFILAFALLFFESYHFNRQNKFALQEVDYWTKGELFTSIDSINFSNYQASLPIPYFNVASDHLNQNSTGFALQKSAVLANQTGLPTIGAMLTRNSISQTFYQWQLVLKPYRSPVIFEDYKSRKPLVIIWFHNPKGDYLSQYGHLLDGAKSIYKKDQLELFETELIAFEERILAEKTSIKKAINEDSLFQINQFKSTDSIENFVYLNFDEKESKKAYLSSGAIGGILEVENQIFKGKIPNIQVDSMYHFQLWAWIFEDKMPNTSLILQEIDNVGNVLQKQRFHIWPESPNHIYTFDPNGWALVDFSFQPKTSNSQFSISFEGNISQDNRIQYFDELLIKPKHVQLYQETEKYWRKDNLWFEK